MNSPITTTTSITTTEDLKTAIDNDSEMSEAFEKLRATQIRIKQRYNCEEFFVSHLHAPFLGFSALVRFQSRAKVHRVKIYKTNTSAKMPASKRPLKKD